MVPCGGFAGMVAAVESEHLGLPGQISPDRAGPQVRPLQPRPFRARVEAEHLEGISLPGQDIVVRDEAPSISTQTQGFKGCLFRKREGSTREALVLRRGIVVCPFP